MVIARSHCIGHRTVKTILIDISSSELKTAEILAIYGSSQRMKCCLRTAESNISRISPLWVIEPIIIVSLRATVLATSLNLLRYIQRRQSIQHLPILQIHSSQREVHERLATAQRKEVFVSP